LDKLRRHRELKSRDDHRYVRRRGGNLYFGLRSPVSVAGRDVALRSTLCAKNTFEKLFQVMPLSA